MKFGVFYEHQVPRPWDEDSERVVLERALEQCELCDRLGKNFLRRIGHISRSLHLMFQLTNFPKLYKCQHFQ